MQIAADAVPATLPLMTAIAPELRAELDQRILLRGLTWEDYERLLAIRGESAGIRITYVAGVVELMSPSTHHEWIKTLVARLLEAWADQQEIELNGYGSWTVKNKDQERGLEPDECYVIGPEKIGSGNRERPDLAIEIVWTGGGIDKLGVYRGLAVPEVWFWQRGRFEVFVLRGDDYAAVPHSELLPGLDLALMARFVDHPNQSQAVREYRQLLRAMRPPTE